MQKWEYLFVTADYALGAWRSRFENDLEVVNWKQGQNIAAYANKKGQEGWELITASYSSITSGSPVPRLVFKRPIS